MKYHTKLGKLSPTEMSDEHLVNRLKYEINKLHSAKQMLNKVSKELTPFQSVLLSKNASMSEEDLSKIIVDAEKYLAPLVFELLLRGQTVDMYINVLRDIYERTAEQPRLQSAISELFTE